MFNTIKNNNPHWQQTIERIVKSVVSIQFSQVSAFDTESACCSQATGFIVDSKRGIILTNRHVVGPGPFSGYAVFDNHEEIPVKPIYRDPVHDFGFLQFDPNLVKYMKVQHLTLRPDLAKVGVEIRVVGNDNGEKLSILSGFISRLNRNAPDYGSLTYNDFNTEYIQAAASASGGSSGSPVVNIDGHAIALQAGGSTNASTDFFLPVNRVLRALNCIQKNIPITRGTIQVTWILKPFDECRRLGLSPDSEARMRSLYPNAIGLLVADIILPEGPADKLIKEGDTLISINGKSIFSFISVDEILDSNVDQNIDIVVQRSGKDFSINCKVQNLHSITPDRYVQVSGAIFHTLSYQMARMFGLPVKGVFICYASGSFRRSNDTGWLIDSIDNKEIPDLDTFIEVMKSIPDGARVPFVCRHVTDMHSPKVRTTYIDRHWYKTFKLAIRNDESGLWDFVDLGDPLPMEKLKPLNAKFIDLPSDEEGARNLSRSIVGLSSQFPITIDSYYFSGRNGSGLIIDAKKGYVLTSRYFVPHDLGNFHITIAGSIIVPAKVIFLHPLYNYAILKYDPSLVLAPLQTPKFSDEPLKRGEKVLFVGNNFSRVASQETRITDISPNNMPKNSSAPRYRASNIKAITIDTNLSSKYGSGVLSDKDGTIRGLWLSCLGETRDDGSDSVYHAGIDATDALDVIRAFQNSDEIPKVRIVDAEVTEIPLSKSRIMGVPEEWISKLENVEGIDRINFLTVSSITCPNFEESEIKSGLEIGDILLAVNDKLISSISDFKVMFTTEELKFTIVRKKKVSNINVKTVEIENTDDIVMWCGALIQKPFHAVRQSMKQLPSGVYISSLSGCSPAMHYGLHSTNFITHVNEQKTSTMEEFLRIIKEIPDNTYVKVRLISFDNIPFALSIKTNYHYFPTFELKKNTKENKWLSIKCNNTDKKEEIKEINVDVNGDTEMK
ncbi:Nma111p [Ascoidea rubescens DSM 1968]|uniref:Pro-apoptotic serine protease NMA111 n=1 Tax=Ascoidea rubescens DSM 1968 TaxID=1344418 RepID=A0A1D2VAS6_9ASCO|nr:trypsin-like serine protease [Ascoidea rubescens DSM 1968]ODV58700.1 trypsin-like serine protease [Ascoidea rubescens DSM 1968]